MIKKKTFKKHLKGINIILELLIMSFLIMIITPIFISIIYLDKISNKIDKKLKRMT